MNAVEPVMRVVSIQDFIDEVFEHDSSPPAGSTVRRLCHEKDEFGQAVIPGAFKMGKTWKIDLDCYYRVMERRLSECEFSDAEEEPWLKALGASLSKPD